MKFSYTLLKKLAPKIPDKRRLIEALNFHAFEAAALYEGEPRPETGREDTIEISVPANRYSDAASHRGVAQIAAAIFGGKLVAPQVKSKKLKVKSAKDGDLDIKIEAKKRSGKYIGRYFEVDASAKTPDWMLNVLESCGLRPINAVVDIMNYVMVEIGEPMHAFDADEIEADQRGTNGDRSGSTRKIIVRLAKAGEKITTLDNETSILTREDLVIADSKGPLAIAGVKGGKRAEVAPKTKRIIVEAANFDGPSIYKTARRLNLFTDASGRFAHGLSHSLADMAMARASQLLVEIAKGKPGAQVVAGHAKEPRRVLKFDIKKFNGLTGLTLKESVGLDYLKKLGFSVRGSQVEIPPTRPDVSMMEDLTEEIVNLYGYDRLPATPPRVALLPSGYEDQIKLKDNLRRILTGFGFSESYNYSFNETGEVELQNPIAEDKKYLRPSLAPLLTKNVEDNLRFYDAVKIFEIGNIFQKGVEERLMLGMVIGGKNKNTILELKGALDEMLKMVGLTEFYMKAEGENNLCIEADHHVLGCVKIAAGKKNLIIAVAELDLEKLMTLVKEEKEYEPLPKYPSVTRDISMFIPDDVRIGEVMVLIEQAARKYLYDVDMIDHFEPPVKEYARERGIEEDPEERPRRGVTFRLVFQADDRTLTDEEVGKEMERIVGALEKQLDVELR